MQRVAAAVLPVLAALLAAAPHAHADAPWVEVKAAGFTVVSDGSEKEARAVLGQLAQVRALLKRVWPWARLDPSRPVVVLAVRDEADLRQLLPEYWEKRNALHPAGVFVTAPDRHWVALRMDVARNRAEDETWGNPYHLVFHEYVHLVLRLNFDRLPAWLNEGLAEFWGNTIIDGDRIYQGRYIGYHISTLRNATLLPIEGLLSARSDQYSDGNRATVLYAQSWALVHYLILGSDQRRGQIDRYAELLRAGRSDEDARREAFGDVSALGRELDSYVRRYAFRSLRTIAALDTATGPVSSRVVPPAESLGLRAGFHVATGRTREAAAMAAEAL